MRVWVWRIMAAGGVVALVWVAAGGLIAQPYQLAATVALSLGVAVSSYLVVVVLLAVIARVVRSSRLRRLLVDVTPQRATRFATGIALLSGVTPAVAGTVGDVTPVVDRQIARVTDPQVEMLLHRFGWNEPLATAATVATYTVVAGDSFWRIATQQVLSVQPTADTRAIAVYWLALIEHNMDELVLAGDPNLLLIGQVVTLPPVLPAGP